MKDFFISEKTLNIDITSLFPASLDMTDADQLYRFQRSGKFQFIATEVQIDKEKVPVVVDTTISSKSFLASYELDATKGKYRAYFLGKVVEGKYKEDYHLYIYWSEKGSIPLVRSFRDEARDVQYYNPKTPDNYAEVADEAIWHNFLQSLASTEKLTVDRLNGALKVLKFQNPSVVKIIIEKLFGPNKDQTLKVVEKKEFQFILFALMSQAGPSEIDLLKTKLMQFLFHYFTSRPELLLSYMDPTSANVLHFLPTDMNNALKAEFITKSLQLTKLPPNVDPLYTALSFNFIKIENIRAQIDKLGMSSEPVRKAKNVIDLFSYLDESKTAEPDKIMMKLAIAINNENSNPSLLFNFLLDTFRKIEGNSQLHWDRYKKILEVLCTYYGNPGDDHHDRLAAIMAAIKEFDFEKKPVPGLFEDDTEKMQFINQRCPKILPAMAPHLKADESNNESSASSSQSETSINNENNNQRLVLSQDVLDLKAVEYLVMSLLLIRPASMGDPVEYIYSSIVELHTKVKALKPEPQKSETELQKISLNKEYIGILYRFAKLIGYVRQNAQLGGAKNVRDVLARLKELQSNAVQEESNAVEIIADIVGRLHKVAVASHQFTTLTPIAHILWGFLGNEKVTKGTQGVTIGDAQDILGAALGKEPRPKPQVTETQPENENTPSSTTNLGM